MNIIIKMMEKKLLQTSLGLISSLF